MVALTEMPERSVPGPTGGPAATTRALGAAVGGGLILPAVALAGSPIHASALVVVLSFALCATVAIFVRRLMAPNVAGLVAGCVAVLSGCFLIASATYPGSGFVVAALVGIGIGPFLPARQSLRPIEVTCLGVATAVIVLLGWQFGSETTAVAFSLLATAATTVMVLSRPRLTRSSPRSPLMVFVVLLYGAFSFFWVGSTSPSVEWLGSLTSHGPADRNEVAITFDDGPDANYTLPIATILEQYGVRGTFFEVGKAVLRNPQITQELMDRGHVVGNHSYHHDAFSYLHPGYPELARTQEVFRDLFQTCPALFRPPHGTHTMFMSRIVENAGMRLVTWDVSAKDWIESDAETLARHILEKVKPGSIILLHDSIDGNPGADRSVVVKALPAILEGLKAKGLTPVTLDKLIGAPAYLSNCR
ncbi:MAG: polysaccharide deacetylase family protein [Anaerolineaceae bacterium]